METLTVSTFVPVLLLPKPWATMSSTRANVPPLALIVSMLSKFSVARLVNVKAPAPRAPGVKTVPVARDCSASGHEVGEFGLPVRSEKPCNQHVGLGPIELLTRHVIAHGRDLEATALAVV